MEPSAPRVSLRVMADAVLPGRVSRDAALFLAPLASLLPPATAPPVA